MYRYREVGRTGKPHAAGDARPGSRYRRRDESLGRATLNNWAIFSARDVAVGADVFIRRSNDVIPEIMGRAGEAGPDETPIERPERCPACGAEFIERGAHTSVPTATVVCLQIVARMSHLPAETLWILMAFFGSYGRRAFTKKLGVSEPWQLYALP